MRRFFRILEYNLFKISTASDSDLTISFFLNYIWSLATDLFEIEGFIVFQNCILSTTFLSNFPWYFFQPPVIIDTHLFLVLYTYRILFPIVPFFEYWHKSRSRSYHNFFWKFFSHKRRLILLSKFSFYWNKAIYSFNAYFTKPLQPFIIMKKFFTERIIP